MGFHVCGEKVEKEMRKEVESIEKSERHQNKCRKQHYKWEENGLKNQK
jgi:hypothetical protein